MSVVSWERCLEYGNPGFDLKAGQILLLFMYVIIIILSSIENMKINITKKQFESLVMALEIADTVTGLLSDAFVDEEEKYYKKRAKEMDELRKVFYSRASEFGLENLVMEHKENWYVREDSPKEEEYHEIMEDFEEWAVQDVLSNKLGKRDFYRAHTKEEIEKIAQEGGGYLGVGIYPYEERYWKEFEKHGYDRLEIIEDKKDRL